MNNLVKISDLFDIVYGVNLELVKLTQCKSTDEDSIIFVSRTEKNNGVSAYVKIEDNIKPNQVHTLSVAAGGSVLATFYQPLPYYSGRDLYVLIPKEKMSVIEMLFYATSIRENKYKYNYGRQANKTLKDIFIPSNIPDELNEHLLSFKRNELNKISIEKIINDVVKMDNTQWKAFKYDTLFDIKKGNTIIDEFSRLGKVPYIRSINSNNGIIGFFDIKPNHSGNTITVNSNGSVGEAFYQSLPFCASGDVNVLYPKFKLNPLIAMFLITMIEKDKFKFNFGRKWGVKRMNRSLIQLPVNEKGDPNWKYMETYIKSLPYSKSIPS